jgi:hypothetical protein
MKQIESILLTIILLCKFQLLSQTLVRFPAGSISPDIVAPNIMASNISFGNGISQITCNNYLVCDGFNQTTNSNALNNGDYFEFTITPNPGFSINISTVSVLTTGSNLVGTPLLSEAYYYKKQSQSTFMFVSSYNSTSLGTNICTSSSSGSIPAPNVVTNEPITFRIVFYNNSSGVQARIGQITVAGDVSLPVNLTSLNALSETKQSILTFTTASEINNAGFDIERSSDGIDFQKIGWVEGHGSTTSEKHYSFVDTNPIGGMNYYRLRQVDFDGRFEYSKIVSIMMKSDDVTISPNPASDILHIQNATSGSYLIKSVLGTIIGQGVLTVDRRIDISNLPSGTYLFYPDSGRPLIFNKL